MTEPQPDQLALVRRLNDERADLAAQVQALKTGGPGSTSGGMDSVDAKISAAEARVDTKFAELRGDLQRFATKGTVWGAAGTIVALLLAVAAFAGDRFDAGMSSSSAVASFSEAQRQRDAAQDQKLNEILRRLPAPTPDATVRK